MIFVLTCALTVVDLIIYTSQSNPFVSYFRFYPKVSGYGFKNQLEALGGALVMLIIIFSGIFLALEVRGAVYFK